MIKAEYSSSFGNNIEIDHGNGVHTMYLHCSSLNVTVGQKVSQGDVIGYVGMTGDATGNHLDLRFKVSATYVDPLTMVTAEIAALPTPKNNYNENMQIESSKKGGSVFFEKCQKIEPSYFSSKQAS